VIAGLIGITIATDAIAWWRKPDVHTQLSWVSRSSLAVAAALLSIVAVPIGKAFFTSRGLSDDIDGVAPDAVSEAADEVSFLLSALARLIPTIGDPLVRGWISARRRVSRIDSLSVRTHPWRVAVALGVAAGTALTISHDLGEGPPDLGILLLLWIVFVTIETAAVVVAFALLGRFLGIVRRDTPGKLGTMSGPS
jgi:hypothetical protein